MTTYSIATVMKNESLKKNVRNYNAEGEMFIMKNEEYLYFKHMGELLILPITVHINEYSMTNILSFAVLANIA